MAASYIACCPVAWLRLSRSAPLSQVKTGRDTPGAGLGEAKGSLTTNGAGQAFCFLFFLMDIIKCSKREKWDCAEEDRIWIGYEASGFPALLLL